MTEYHVLIELAVEEPEVPDAADWYGFTTYPGTITVTGADGLPRYFVPGLIAYTLPGRSADLYAGGGVSTGSASGTVSLDVFPALRLLKLGVRFQRMRVRMWWWSPGQTLAEAVQVWIGQLTDPDINDDAGTFAFRVDSGTREQDAALPRGYIGDDGRFPDAPDPAKPQAVPVLYGRVRNLPAYRLDDDPGPSPPAPATNIRFMICGHPTPTFLCRLTDNEGMTSALTAPSIGTDGRGDQFTYITVQNTLAGWTEGGSYFINAASGWKAPGEPGAAFPFSNDVLVHRLGDVLVHLVTTYAAERFFELDRERIFAARSLLNRFRVGMMFNSPSAGSVLQALKSRFERQFPVTFNFAAGLFGWDYAGIPPGDEPHGHIVWKQNAHTRTSIRPVPLSALRSRFEIAYNLDGYAGGNTTAIRRDETNSGPCRAAFERWGISTVQRLEVPDTVYDDTARLLAEEQISRLTVRRLRTSYIVDEPKWLRWPLFARVHVTDPDRGWVDEPFLVEGITPQRPGNVVMSLISERGI